MVDMTISTTFLNTQITATEAAITAYQAASLAFATNGALLSYRLDTGQSIVNVTRADLDMLQNTIEGLMNQLSMLCARRDGSGTVIGTPAC